MTESPILPRPRAWSYRPPDGSNRLDSLGSRVADAPPVRVVLAATRHRGGPRHDDDARAGRHRICGGVRDTGHQRPLRDHRAAARVRRVRSQPHSGSRTGLGARGRDPRSGPAPVGRRTAARGCAGRNDGDRLRRGVRRCRPGTPRLHHRAAVETDPLRLHERHRADRDPEPDPEALRLFRERGRTTAPGAGNRRESVGGQHQRHGACDWRRLARADSRAEAVAATSRAC